jgi:hypothetical protein
MIDQYAKSKTVATRKYFEISVILHESDDNNFAVTDVQCSFAGSSDNILLEMLQYFNDSVLTEAEMRLIYNGLIDKNIRLDVYKIISLYSIATLIKIYKIHGFKYIFIPVIIDYGRGGDIQHQTALIIDISTDQYKMIFYEPYGMYTKYGHSYKNAIKDLLQCFTGFVGFDNIVPYTTYHDMLDITKKNGGGLQNIILTANNNKSVLFNFNCGNIIKELIKEFDIDLSYIVTESELSDDKTICILDILHAIDNINISNFTSEKKSIYYKILNDILTTYGVFNSKTCVTITIVELNKFFMFSQESNNNIPLIKSKIRNMYDLYKTQNPNSVLMNEIYELANVFKHSNNIINLLQQQQQLKTSCHKF